MVLALFLITVAFASAQQNYTRSNLWDKEIEAFGELDRKTVPARTDVLFVGSSSIRNWKTVASDFAGVKALNRGFGGSHLEDVIFYTPRIVLPYKPKLVVLYAGENDLTAGKSVARVFDDFNAFVIIVHNQLPKTRIIFISLKPSPARWKLREQFQQLNDLVKEKIGRDKRMQYVDVWAAMLGPGGEPRKDIFQSDGLHMNAEGYEIWQRMLEPYVRGGLRGSFR